MLEKPELQEDRIISCLRERYGLGVCGVAFLPLGNDSTAWVYRVESDEPCGRSYFLKVKRGTVYEPALFVPRYLKDQGIEQVVAPLPTAVTGGAGGDERALWARVDDTEFVLILYPFVEGRTGMESGMSDEQWVEFGTVLKRIHSNRPPPPAPPPIRRTQACGGEGSGPPLQKRPPPPAPPPIRRTQACGGEGSCPPLQKRPPPPPLRPLACGVLGEGPFLRSPPHRTLACGVLGEGLGVGAGHLKKERFSPPWSGMVRRLEAKIQANEYDSSFEKEVASFWRERRDEIRQIVERAEELGRMLRRMLEGQSNEFVLCHADIHTANILLDQQDKMFIVDWDETILAPKERDLMFVVGDLVDGVAVGEKADLFFKGYGKTEINLLALAYYRYEWVVQEIGDYGERVFFMKDIGHHTKKDAVQGFIELFQPGDVVESAYQSDSKQ